MGWNKPSGGGGLYRQFKKSSAPTIWDPNDGVTFDAQGTMYNIGFTNTVCNVVTFSENVNLTALSYKLVNTNPATCGIRVYDMNGTLLGSTVGTSTTGTSGGIVKETLSTPLELKANTKYAIGFVITEGALAIYTKSTGSFTSSGGVTLTHSDTLRIGQDAYPTTSYGYEVWTDLDWELAGPAPEDQAVASSLWYDETNKVMKFCNGTSWVSM